MNKESPEDYAQRRANETGRAYFVTGMGHAQLNCAMNRRGAEELGGIVKIYRPKPPIESIARVEVTDTFGGEANYSWVRRYSFPVRKGDSDLAIMRKAKAIAGYTGLRGRSANLGDSFEFRPWGLLHILFVTFDPPEAP